MDALTPLCTIRDGAGSHMETRKSFMNASTESGRLWPPAANNMSLCQIGRLATDRRSCLLIRHSRLKLPKECKLLARHSSLERVSPVTGLVRLCTDLWRSKRVSIQYNDGNSAPALSVAQASFCSCSSRVYSPVARAICLYDVRLHLVQIRRVH